MQTRFFWISRNGLVFLVLRFISVKNQQRQQSQSLKDFLVGFSQDFLIASFAMDSRRVAALLMVVSMVLFSMDKAEAASKHCTWHGTAPMCLPSCPSDKQVIKESACGKAKLACCITGKKKLCCPKSLGNIDPALAEAMAE